MTNLMNDDKVQMKIDSINLHRASNWELIQDSPMVKFDYDEIEVPADFDEALDEKQQQEDLKNRYRFMTPEERRSLANEVVLYTLRRPHAGDKKLCIDISDWTWDKVEAPLQLIQDTDIETYYGTSEDEAMLQLAATICAPTVLAGKMCIPRCLCTTRSQTRMLEWLMRTLCSQSSGLLDSVMITMVNGCARQRNLPRSQTYSCSKYQGALSKKMMSTNIKHISEFFSTTHENKWSMHSKVREWVTGCLTPHVPNWLEKLQKSILSTKMYWISLELYNKYRYHSRYWEHNDGEFKEVIDLMKKMHEMQVFILDGHDEQAIAQKSMELFKVADADYTIAHEDIHILGEYLKEFLEPLYPLL